MRNSNPNLEPEIGKRCIDFKKIFTKARLAGVERFFIEQENDYVPVYFDSIV